LVRYVEKNKLPYTLDAAFTETDATTALKTGDFDLVLLDYDLETTTGLEFLPHAGDMPVIFITGSGAESVAVEAMRRGASDYLIKDPARNYLTVLPITIRNVLERKTAEKALLESEARFRALTEKASDLVLILDPTGTCTYASPSFNRFGNTPGEMVGQKPDDFIHPDDLDYIMESLDVAAQRPYQPIRLNETRIHHQSGLWVSLEGELTSMPDQLGVNGTVFSGRDMTHRKRIEEALYNSEETLRTTLNSISDLVFSLDVEGRFVEYHQPKQHPDLYAPPEVFLGKNFREVMPPQLVVLMEIAIKEAIATGDSQLAEYPVDINGETEWFEAKIAVRKTFEGEDAGITSVTRNITQRKQAEEELRKAHNLLEQRVEERTAELKRVNQDLEQEIMEHRKSETALKKSEERLNKFMESATEAFFLLDSNLDILDINKLGLELMRKKKDEVIGENLADVMTDLKEMGWYDRHLETLDTGEPLIIEDYNFLPQSGEMSCTLKSFKVGDGLGIILIDTTQGKKLEDQLRQAQKMEAIGSLAGGIAHDFNNILGIIMGYTELAMDDVPEDKLARDNLDQVLSAAGRAREMVKQILAFSRKDTHERRATYLGNIVAEILVLLRSTLPSTIEIRSHIEPSLSPVLADSTQLHQVIMNLSTNAAHAMKEKGGVFEITLEEVDIDPDTDNGLELTQGRYQRLTFNDTGHGMKPEVIRRIFEPYYTTKDQGEGTGMGLAVVHGILRGHGGDIIVSSEPGKGTAFKLFLPVTAMEIIPGDEPSQPTQGGDEYILMVDDEEPLLQMNKLMLNKLGYRVEARTRSLDALELFRENPQRFDLVISDQTMPDMTGIQLTAELHRIRTDIPVILCTGFSEQVNEDNYKTLGCSGFVMKPIVKKEMDRVIRSLLEKQ
ncbi:MAG: PAS domain S-box protein, partial [bacterium]|nr:PAS domain S-box protein [bacterium]